MLRGWKIRKRYPRPSVRSRRFASRSAKPTIRPRSWASKGGHAAATTARGLRSSETPLTFHSSSGAGSPPSNPLNALISFGNSLCYSVCLRQLYHTALDPTVSYLHEPGDRRFSLALDLAEVFKPLLVDRAIFRLVKTRQIQPSDFEKRLGGTYLTESGRKTFVEHWDERLRQTIKHRSLDRKISYERLVRLDAYRLVRHLCDPDEDPYSGFEI